MGLSQSAVSMGARAHYTISDVLFLNFYIRFFSMRDLLCDNWLQFAFLNFCISKLLHAQSA